METAAVVESWALSQNEKWGKYRLKVYIGLVDL